MGPSLLRSQCGFVLPVKFLLVRHAFIYIHFPVLCGPSPSAEGKTPAKLPSQTLSQTAFHRIFQLLAQMALVRFHGRKCVHTRPCSKDRTRGHTRRNRGISDGGGITTLGLFHTFRKPCAAGYQNGKLCRFWGLAVGAPKERREPSGQRCAYARRCPEASRPRWAA